MIFALAVAAHAAPAIHRDVIYGTADGVELKLDACVPDGPGPFPVAILVHGGGWSTGDKAGSNHPGDSADVTPWFAPLSAAHFVWFSINYRLAPAHPWPACIDDVKTAIRWAKAHAAEYRGDPKRIALFGHSAGGHLACLAGTDPNPDVRVQAVVGCAAVTDSEYELPTRKGISKSLQALFQLPPDITPHAVAILRDTAPVNHVSPGLPPVLLIHGSADRTVPIQESKNYQAKLRAAGDRCDLIVIPGAPHRLLSWSQFDPAWTSRMTDWLQGVLGGAGTSGGAAAY